jgi:hypothetical protein
LSVKISTNKHIHKKQNKTERTKQDKNALKTVKLTNHIRQFNKQKVKPLVKNLIKITNLLLSKYVTKSVLTKFAAYAHLEEGQFLHGESTWNIENFLSIRESS